MLFLGELREHVLKITQLDKAGTSREIHGTDHQKNDENIRIKKVADG